MECEQVVDFQVEERMVSEVQTVGCVGSLMADVKHNNACTTKQAVPLFSIQVFINTRNHYIHAFCSNQKISLLKRSFEQIE